MSKLEKIKFIVIFLLFKNDLFEDYEISNIYDYLVDRFGVNNEVK